MDADYARLLTALTFMCDDRMEAEDALQHALVRLWERGRLPDSLPAWTMAVALNRLRSRFRHFKTQRRAMPMLIELETDPADVADRVAVRRAVADLPRRQREVTVLRYYLGHGPAEIAPMLGVSESSVRGSLRQARLRLAAALGGEEVIDEP